MKSFEKHHYGPWLDRNTGLGGLGKLTVQKGEAHSKCTRCGIDVKMAQTGGIKFWVGGKWVAKRPPCPSAELVAKADKIAESLVLQGVDIEDRAVDEEGNIRLFCKVDLNAS